MDLVGTFTPTRFTSSSYGLHLSTDRSIRRASKHGTLAPGDSWISVAVAFGGVVLLGDVLIRGACAIRPSDAAAPGLTLSYKT